MSNAQAKALRTKINRLSGELEITKTKAEIRNIKEQIRAAEIELTEG